MNAKYNNGADAHRCFPNRRKERPGRAEQSSPRPYLGRRAASVRNVIIHSHKVHIHTKKKRLGQRLGIRSPNLYEAS
ncbi:hypothetical protein Q5P01_003451 [Channa striata]|uniref:Uncharacterized protein n=1 Tax=Channa striata TaxID=64152 RepID=A0AA88NMF5_CHASR|nr:hypothetical protein Q5P01_003451 [Channa striata]